MRGSAYLHESMGNLRLRHSKKVVSPVVEEFFYKRVYDKRATTAISADEVEVAVLMQLEVTAPAMTETAT